MGWRKGQKKNSKVRTKAKRSVTMAIAAPNFVDLKFIRFGSAPLRRKTKILNIKLSKKLNNIRKEMTTNVCSLRNSGPFL